MRPVLLFVICLLVVCCVDKTEAGVGELFENIGHAFSVAWNSVIDQIKRPVQVRRLGPGGRLKTTPAFISSDSRNATFLEMIARASTSIYVPIFTNATTLKPDHYEATIKYAPQPSALKLMLPLITTPEIMNPANWQMNDRFPTLKPKVNVPDAASDSTQEDSESKISESNIPGIVRSDTHNATIIENATTTTPEPCHSTKNARPTRIILPYITPMNKALWLRNEHVDTRYEETTEDLWTTLENKKVDE